MRRGFTVLAGVLFLTGCGEASHPPEELAGLWSAGPAACEAGVGVRFTSEAIETVYGERAETLFAHPHYTMEGEGDTRRVRITYELPTRPGGAQTVGARGVLLLARGDDGRIIPEMHNLLDGRTGAARLRLADDPAREVLALEPCGPSPWGAGLRGLS
jgi:hypothetical protein